MAEAGYGNTLATLELINSFSKEKDYIILSKMMSQVYGMFFSHAFPHLGELSQECLPVPALEKRKEMKRTVLSPKIATLGWVYPTGEDHLVSMKRTLVISAAGEAGLHHNGTVQIQPTYIRQYPNLTSIRMLDTYRS